MNPFLSQLNNQPVLIDHAQFVAMLPELSQVGARAHVGESKKLEPQAYAYSTGISLDGKRYKPYQMVGNIAVIQVSGVLLHKYGWSWSYATGYDVLQRKLKFAASDRDVKGIYLDFHTPGGSVSGCADTADLIAEIGKTKPICGHINDGALSAGQWLYSQCTYRYTTQSGHGGSIGALIMHVNQQKYLDNIGIEVDLIYAGDRKVDGNAYSKLSADVRKSMHNSLVSIRQEFAAAVARGTGLSIDTILATEAGTFTGQANVDLGISQQIIAGHKGVETFAAAINTQGSFIMTGTQSAAPQPQANAETTTPAPQAALPIEQANATTAEPIAETPTNVPAATAATTERERIAGIMKAESATGRAELASYLALETDLSVDAATAIMAKAGIESRDNQANDQSALSALMNAEQTPAAQADVDTTAHSTNSTTPDAAESALELTMRAMNIKPD